ncbi:ras-related protein Rab-8B-like isoform X2 [Littorina saxatilis]|uniref:ras-related protein Rab-8B-like isoform X2 n=1 Tax=Littorina saxatilis TaxID=31220 RepID=UPI0038B4F0EE
MMPLDESDCAATYKVLVVGEHSVGKTALLNRLMNREFRVSMMPTIGVDFVKKIFEVDGALVQLVIWDTAGQERFRSITRLQYRGVQGIVLVYDVTNSQSFTHLQFWINSIHSEIRHSQHQYEPIPIILCGNKADMADSRQVDTRQGEKLSREEMAFEFYETSAKTGDNVFLAFQRLAYHVTDICDPKLMKSYHPFMIKQEDMSHKQNGDSVTPKRKQKWKAKKAKVGHSKLPVFPRSLCCVSQQGS